MVNLPRRGDGGQCRRWRWPCSARVIRDQSTGSGARWHIRARADQRPPSAAAEGVEDGLEPQPPVLQTDRRSSGPGRQVPIGPAQCARVSGPRVGWSETVLLPRAVSVRFLPHPCRTYSTPMSRRPSCPSGTATIVFPDGIGIAEFCLLRGLAPVGVVPKPRGPRSVRFHRRSPR